MQFEDFDLVLKDIQPFLSDSVFDYFISIMHSEGSQQETELRLRGNSMESEFKDKNFKTTIIKDMKTVPSSSKTFKSKQEGSKSSGSYWYPAKPRPIREKGSGPECDILCSQLPVCRNIVSKVNLIEAAIEGNSGESSFVYEEDKVQETDDSEKVIEKSYEEIVGKIVDVDLDPGVLPPPSEMKVKAPTMPLADKGKGPKKKRVCNYSHPVTNPLYKNYNPKGYIKSDEELARDFIMGFMDEFNKWLASLEGDLVQLDPEIIFKILRIGLETA